jgi:ankyrin repeat protein
MASAGDTDEMGTLLTAGQESPSEETIQDLLTAAAKSSDLEVVNSLLTQHPSVPLNEEIVRAAVNTGSIPIFQTLLARDPSLVNMHFDRRGTPLIVACMGRQTVEYLRFLLEAGADPNQDPDAASFPLALVAALYTDPAAIDLLLQHGARLERSGALAAAARRGNESMIRCLLDRGARLDTDAPAMGTDASPLHVAVRAGHAGVARILLQHGADPNSTNARGTTAVEFAKQMRVKGKDMTEMMEVLGGERRR